MNDEPKIIQRVVITRNDKLHCSSNVSLMLIGNNNKRPLRKID